MGVRMPALNHYIVAFWFDTDAQFLYKQFHHPSRLTGQPKNNIFPLHQPRLPLPYAMICRWIRNFSISCLFLFLNYSRVSTTYLSPMLCFGFELETYIRNSL